MVLIIVLLVISLTALLAVNMNFLGASIRRTASDDGRELEAKWLLMGAESAIRNVMLQQLTEHEGELPDAIRWIQGQRINFLGRSVWYQIDDLSACFNLNWLLANDKKKAWVSAGWLNRLLHSMGGKPINMMALQQTLGDNLFSDKSQLLQSQAIPEQLYRRVSPLLCTTGGQEASRVSVNLNDVLSQHLVLLQTALQNPLPLSVMVQLIRQRPINGWKKLQEITPLIPQFAQAEFLAFSSSDYMLNLVTENGGRMYVMSTRLHLDNKGQMITMERYFNSHTQ